jgi:hypothetical protein
MKSLIKAYTIQEGGGWIPIDEQYGGIVLNTSEPVNKKPVASAMGLSLDTNITAILTRSGDVYDFVIGCWRNEVKNPIPTPSIHTILTERGTRYGIFSSHASITQDIKEAMKGLGNCTTNWPNLSASQKEALEMIAHKIGRILNGDPYYKDSWVDIVGYTQLVVNELESAESTVVKKGGI